MPASKPAETAEESLGRSSRLERKRKEARALLSFYRALLSPRQQRVAQGFCVEGKSYSQIAREQNVSRQAVHETMKAVGEQLAWFEERLMLFARAQKHDRAAQHPIRLEAQVQEWLIEFERKLQNSSRGAIPSWVEKELDRLRTLLPPE